MNATPPAGFARVALVVGVAGEIRRRLSFVSLCALVLICARPAPAAPQLLPGVYGYGLDRADNTAGFGANAEIVHVKTLVDNGSNASPTPDSLRAALVMNPGHPRTVVFDVGGEIKLKGNLSIAVGDITIAGQTAPSPGITLRGTKLSVTASNVLVQHIRVRPGDSWVPGPNNHDRDAVGAANPSALVTNVVFDHCTFAWSLDEIASTWYAYDNVAFHRCIFAEPLNVAIHLDEDTLEDNVPKAIESLDPDATNFTGDPDTATSADAVGGNYRVWEASADGATLDFDLPIVAATNQSNSEHLVVGGFTGPDHARFKVQVWFPGDSLLDPPRQESDVFDQYDAAVGAVSYIAKPDTTGFTIPIGTTSLKVRITVMGRNPSSTGWKLGIDLISLSQGHAMGPLFGSGTTGAGRVSFIGSVLAHFKERGPWVGAKHFVFADNVIYDRSNKMLMLGGQWNDQVNAAVVGNTFIEGSSLGTTSNAPIMLQRLPTGGMQVFETDNAYSPGGRSYTDMFDDALEPYRVGADPTDDSDGIVGFIPLPQSQAYEAALKFAGARPMDRDDQELRIIDEVAQGAVINDFHSRPGRVRHTVVDAGGWVPYTPSANIPWPEPANPNTDPDLNGYTVLEETLQQQAALLEGTLTPDGALQAESAVRGPGVLIADNYSGFHGTGFVDFPGGSPTNGTLTFNNVDGGAGGAKVLRIRYALSAGSRTGQVVVNGSAQNITFNSTGAFSTWATKDVAVTATSGATNTIVLKSTGQDLASIDEINLVGPATFDNFDDGNSNGWTTFGGTWGMVTDGTPVLRQADAAAISPFAFLSNNGDDQGITADAKVVTFGQANSWFGVAARYTDPSNYYYAKITTTTAEIKKIQGGAVTQLASTSFASTTGVWYTVKLEVIGSTLKLYIDGVLKATATDNAFSVGKAGMLMYRAAVEYDNVSLDPTPVGATLASDNFEDGNSTGWSTSGGTWSVVTDGTKMFKQSDAGATTTSRAVTGSSWGDQAVEVKTKPLSFAATGKWCGIMARYNDANNYYYLKLASGNTIELKKVAAGVLTTLASGSYTVATGTTYTLKLEAVGTSLRAYINGQLVLRANDGQFAAGTNGVGVVTYGATAEFDDVLVTSP